MVAFPAFALAAEASFGAQAAGSTTRRQVALSCAHVLRVGSRG
jgi:hypothetical protein